MPTYKLVYFDARGRVEPLRLMFALKNIPFEDVRLQDGPEWNSYRHQTPYDQLPTLEIDGKLFTQSVPMTNYVAREIGLFGKTNMEALEIEQIMHLVLDFGNLTTDIFFEKDPERKAALKKKFGETEIPKFFGYFHDLVKKNATVGHAVGSSLTAADIWLFDSVTGMLKSYPGSANLKKDYPRLQAIVDKVIAIPEIKNYIANRKDTED